MANVKNFGLVGVGTSVQFGKAGPSLSKDSATVLRADGTAAFMVPVGSTANRSGLTTTGMIRVNNDTPAASIVEYYNGTSWTSLATGGTAVTSVTGTAGRITVDNTNPTTPIVDISTSYVGQSTITTLGTVATGTWQGSTVTVPYGGTGATTLTANGVVFGNGTSAVGVTAAGTQYQVLQAGSGGTPEFGAVNLGQAAAVTGVLPAANGGTGVANTNTITLGGNISTVGAFSTTGTGGVTLNTVAGSSVTVPASGTLLTTGDTSNYVSSVASSGGTITVSPGTGNVDVSLPNVGTAVTGQFVKITTDAQGRVSATTPVVTSDITTLVSGTYVDVAGDTMTGTLVFGTGVYPTIADAPTTGIQAANKAYVDAVAAGLTWKTAAKAASVWNLVLSGPQTVDGVALVAEDRVLVKNQRAGAILATDTLVAGTGYTNGTYNGVALTGGAGSGATANITVAGGVVSAVTIVNPGIGYADNNTLSALAADIGGTGSGFSVDVNGVSTAGAEADGIYIVKAGAWVRADDANTPAELDSATIFVQQGTSNADTGWTQTATIVTVGTTPQVWVQFSGSNTYVWGIGLAASGNTVNVNLGAGIAQLPSDEVGIDLYDSANNPLILTLNGSARDTTTGAALALLLDGSSLSKSTTGLRVAAGGVDLTSMVTGILPPANGGTGVANAPTSTITLGGALATSGAFASTFTMTGATAVTFPTSGTLLSTANIAANAVTSITFGSTGLTPNTATNGVVSVAGTLVVGNGGTGLTTVTTGQIPYGAGASPLATSAALSFDGTDTLTVGSTTIEGASGGDTTITAGGTSDLNLNPGTGGAVVIGPAGAGLIQSDSNQNLTVQATGTGVLALTSGGDIVLNLAASNAFKVSVVGPSDAQYIDGLANNDLVTKYYVDQVASAGGAGDVKAVQATVNLGANASTNIGAALPAGATILSVKVNVTVVNTTSTLVVGKSGGSEYMIAAENDPQTVGLYLAETMVTEGSSVQVQATVAGQTGGVGSCEVIVTYKLA